MSLHRTAAPRPVRTTAAGRALAALAAGMLLTGCGGAAEDRPDAAAPPPEAAPAGDGPASPENVEAAAPQACPLTAAEVTAALGLDVVAQGATCSFASTSTFAEVHYATVPSDVFAADEPTAVSGIGDKAHLGPSKELYVQAGDLSFSIQVLVSQIDTGIDGDEVQKELARRVIDRAG